MREGASFVAVLHSYTPPNPLCRVDTPLHPHPASRGAYTLAAEYPYNLLSERLGSRLNVNQALEHGT